MISPRADHASMLGNALATLSQRMIPRTRCGIIPQVNSLHKARPWFS